MPTHGLNLAEVDAEKKAQEQAAFAKKKAEEEAAVVKKRLEEEALIAKKKAEDAAAVKRKLELEEEAALAKKKAEEEAAVVKRKLELEEEAALAKKRADEQAAARATAGLIVRLSGQTFSTALEFAHQWPSPSAVADISHRVRHAATSLSAASIAPGDPILVAYAEKGANSWRLDEFHAKEARWLKTFSGHTSPITVLVLSGDLRRALTRLRTRACDFGTSTPARKSQLLNNWSGR